MTAIQSIKSSILFNPGHAIEEYSPLFAILDFCAG
jgi:hypothetical protein